MSFKCQEESSASLLLLTIRLNDIRKGGIKRRTATFAELLFGARHNPTILRFLQSLPWRCHGKIALEAHALYAKMCCGLHLKKTLH